MKAHNEEVQNEIDSLLHYLKENKDRMNYKHVKKEDIQLAVVESNHLIKQFAILA